MSIFSNLDGRGFNSHQLQRSIRGRVVKGTGLIIRFPLEIAGSNPVECRLEIKIMKIFILLFY